MSRPGLWNIAQDQPELTAIVDTDGRAVSYAELARAANRYGRGLQAMGLRPGDAIVVLLPNSADLLAVHFAALQIGLYVVYANFHLTGAEVAYLIEDSGAKVFVAHQRFSGAAGEAAARSGLPAGACFAVGEIAGFAPLGRLGAGEPDSRPDERTAGSAMLYTSGTTGRPKGVRRPLSGEDPDVVPAVATLWFAIFGLKPFDGNVHLCGSPLYHAANLSFATASVQFGHTVVLMDRWTPEQALTLIERHRVTHSHMVPTQFHRLLALPEEKRCGYDVSSLRAAVHGAAPCPRVTKQRMIDWWGPVITEYYAATEGGGTVITATDWLRKPGSVGTPWPGSVVKVLDAEGNEVPAGDIGTVYLRMGNTDFAYYRDEDKTRAAHVGKLYTAGDLGHLDEDGYLFLHDRRHDLIISGGVNIYPAEIEGELMGHEWVVDVAVFGVPNTEWGQEVKAVVQLADGVAPGDTVTDELVRYLAARLAKFKLPKSVDYLPELPRDPNGKLYKRKLRDPYWQDA